MTNEKGIEIVTGQKYRVTGKPGKYILASVRRGTETCYLVPDVGALAELENISVHALRK